jgi:hypothetical protein
MREKKLRLWTHFSAFEVWENIRDGEIVELLPRGQFAIDNLHFAICNRRVSRRGAGIAGKRLAFLPRRTLRLCVRFSSAANLQIARMPWNERLFC